MAKEVYVNEYMRKSGNPEDEVYTKSIVYSENADENGKPDKNHDRGHITTTQDGTIDYARTIDGTVIFDSKNQ